MSAGGFIVYIYSSAAVLMQTAGCLRHLVGMIHWLSLIHVLVNTLHQCRKHVADLRVLTQVLQA